MFSRRRIRAIAVGPTCGESAWLSDGACRDRTGDLRLAKLCRTVSWWECSTLTNPLVSPFPEEMEEGDLEDVVGPIERTTLREGTRQTIELYRARVSA